jgi:hydrogenase-4 component B
MQYTAAGLALPIRIIFQKLVRPYREIKRDFAHGYFVSSVHYEAGVHPVYERHFYNPILKGVISLAHQIRTLQNGSLRSYLAYLVVTLVAVLLLTR